MYVKYEQGDIVKLRRTYEYDDLGDWGFDGQDELDALRMAEDNGYNAEIVSEEAEGYYTIMVCADGEYQRFDAICVYHLYPATDNIIAELDLARYES